MLRFLVNTLLYTQHYDLAKFLGLLPFMPIKIRKLFLTFTRVQTLSSMKLYQELATLETSGYGGFTVDGHYYNTRRLLEWMRPYEDKPLSLGFISMILRVEEHSDLDELEQALKEALDKEIQAAIDPAKDAVFNYECLFSNDPMDRYKPISKNHAEGHRVSTYFYNRISSLRDTLSEKIPAPIIPTYARKKNTSRSMARLYNQYSNVPLEEHEVTFLDCLKLYGKTGIQVQGETELRVAFRYTDLAPRAYYAVGGNAFWKAAYVKHFAKRLTTCLPVTSPTGASRYNISRLNYKQSHTVLLYDYSSFTSNLGALKGFLTGLADFFTGVPLSVWDPFHGVHEIDLGVMIMEYNEVLNEKLLFSLDRVYPTVNGGEEFYMAKNGPLGAQGNINFSMILHGLNIALAIDDLNLCNVVGDDAIVLLDMNVWEKEYILGVINLLGAVAERKTIWIKWEWWMTEEDVKEASWHFMKRPLRVFGDRIYEGVLFDFPSFGFLQPDDGYHVQRGDGKDNIEKFIVQTGAFFDDIESSNLEFDQWEVDLVKAVLGTIYEKFGLSKQGHLPGKMIYSSNFKEYPLKLAVPPLLDDCWRYEWRKLLWDGVETHGFIEDVDYCVSRDSYVEDLCWEWTVTCKSRVMSVLVDFGLVEMKLKRRWYDTASPEDRKDWLESKESSSLILYDVRQVMSLGKVYRELYNAYSL
nr:hypothetical protein [Heterobasidion ambi-like virus 3]WOH21566.1 hypothetical protein [Heterobasidion ambi-like virus 3]